MILRPVSSETHLNNAESHVENANRDLRSTRSPVRDIKSGHFSNRLVLAILVASLAYVIAMGIQATSSQLLLACWVGVWFSWFVQLPRRRHMEKENAQNLRRLEVAADENWELREREERYRFLSQVFGDLVIHRDEMGHVLFANDAFIRTFQTPIRELLEKPLPAHIRDALSRQATPEMRFSEGLTGSPNMPSDGDIREVCLTTPDGPRWFWWIDFPFREGGNGGTSIRSVARDITAHKRSEFALLEASRKASAASDAKSRFLANVSHEMRTPLNGILGMSDLLSDTQLTPEQETYNNAVRTSGSALLGLIEDILDVTKIEAGRFDLRHTETDIAALVQEVSELLSVRAHSKQVDLSAFVSAKIPARVLTDEGRLRQVLVNLVGNAVKFTTKGEVSLRVRIDLSSPQKPMIAFEVADTGPGMTEEAMGRIFGEFEQADAGNTRSHGGAGLGLSISQSIVQAMGGEIIVKSKLGNGSTFHFALPLMTKAGSFKGDNAIAEDATMRQTSTLVISRQHLEAQNIADAIAETGAVAEVVSTIQQALQKLKDSDRVFTHLLVDGAITANPLRSLSRLMKQTKTSPHTVIMVRPESRSKLPSFMKNGFQSYLIKPLRRSSLLRVLATPVASHDMVEAPQMVTPGAPELINTFDERAVDGTEQDREKNHEMEFAASRNLRILLAEDNPINALLAQSVLKKAGHAITHVENGKLAFSTWKTAHASPEAYDLVLLDLHMPVMDGLQAVEKIRHHEQKSEASPVPVVVLTADEQAATRDAALAAGASGFMTKPIVPARLMELTCHLPEALSGKD